MNKSISTMNKSAFYFVAYDDKIHIEIIDFGVGIDDIEKAKKPFYTSKPESERSGMGFTVMESYMDKVEVKNNKEGVTVSMFKSIEPTLVEM